MHSITSPNSPQSRTFLMWRSRAPVSQLPEVYANLSDLKINVNRTFLILPTGQVAAQMISTVLIIVQTSDKSKLSLETKENNKSCSERLTCRPNGQTPCFLDIPTLLIDNRKSRAPPPTENHLRSVRYFDHRLRRMDSKPLRGHPLRSCG